MRWVHWLFTFLAVTGWGTTYAAGPLTNLGAVSWAAGDWQSVQTAHFVIHAPARLQGVVPKVAAYAEDAHQRITQDLQWTPKRRTELVLRDDVDDSNGFASPLPFNLTHLFVSAPDAFNSLEAYDDYLRLLIEHEYTHIVHLDQAAGIPAAIRKGLGRNPLLFPQIFQPTFLQEGLAIHEETHAESGVGRGVSSLYAMQMRAEVEAGLASLHEVVGVNDYTGRGQQYLYGAWWYQFLEETRGQDATQRWLAGARRQIIPFWLNPVARKRLGKDFVGLWADYQAWLSQKFAPLKSGAPQGTAITVYGSTDLPALAAGGYVYRVRADGHALPELARYDASGKEERLVDTENPGPFDVAADGTVVMARRFATRENQFLSDLWRYKPGTWRWERLTDGGRYRDVQILPNGDLLTRLLVDGVSELHVLDANGQAKAKLWRGEAGETLGPMDVSPDGQSLVAAYKPLGTSWQIAKLDLASTRWVVLTQSQNLHGSPRFSPDGARIVFNADYGGRYNAYSMPASGGALVQLTDITTGAFSPVLAADGSLWFERYNAEGYDLHRLAADALLQRAVSGQSWAQKQPRMPPAAVTLAPAAPYSPWPSLAPTSWLPYVLVAPNHGQYGASVAGQDALGTYSYGLTLAWDDVAQSPVGGVVLGLDNRALFAASRTTSTVRRDDTVLRLRAHDAVTGIATNLANTDKDRLALHAGLSYDRYSDAFVADGVSERPSFTQSTVGLALEWDERRSQRFNMGVSNGWYGLALAESQDLLGGDFSGNRYQLDLRKYWHLGQSHVLAARYVGAYADSRALPFALGSDTGARLETLVNAFARDQYALRGYAPFTAIRNRFHLASAEYRFPLWRLQRNWQVYPVGAKNVHGQVFVDSAAFPGTGRTLTGVGAQLTLDALLGYRALIPLSLGAAKGLDKDLGEGQVWLSANLPF